ncbi:MAG: sulfur carrier protein ThiS [Spirochaetes bacterium]|nr:sulfur carrier protein ThiS [Spirochaetota bacterium]
MTISVNGESESYPEDGMTVSDLLRKKRYSFPLIIIRIDGVLVARARYDDTAVRDGNSVDLYHLVSGG